MNANGKSKYIAALDIGTTTIRCYIFDSNVQIVGIANEQVNNVPCKIVFNSVCLYKKKMYYSQAVYNTMFFFF